MHWQIDPIWLHYICCIKLSMYLKRYLHIFRAFLTEQTPSIKFAISLRSKGHNTCINTLLTLQKSGAMRTYLICGLQKITKNSTRHCLFNQISWIRIRRYIWIYATDRERHKPCTQRYPMGADEIFFFVLLVVLQANGNFCFVDFIVSQNDNDIYVQT